MADLDIDPFFTLVKAWKEEDLPDPVVFERTKDDNKRLKDRVIPDNGEKTIEFFYDVTLAGFNDMQEALEWPGHEKWIQFRKCLKGDMRTQWDELVADNYPTNTEKTDANFKKAVPKLVIKFLNNEVPRDVMLTWLAPNGGAKKTRSNALNHLRCAGKLFFA